MQCSSMNLVKVPNVGVVCREKENLHKEPAGPAGPAVVASHLVQECNLVSLVNGSHVPATRSKARVPGANYSWKIV